MPGQHIGYIRAGSLGQNTDRQLDGLQLDHIFEDKVSGKDTNRPKFQEMMEFAREGDTVIIHSMDRLARNLDDLRQTVQLLNKKGVAVEFIHEHLTFTGEDTPMANLLLSVMGAFAEFERALIKERQLEGIAIAKQKGVYKGRKKSLTDEDIAQIKAQLEQPGAKKAVVAREWGVSRATLYGYLS